MWFDAKRAPATTTGTFLVVVVILCCITVSLPVVARCVPRLRVWHRRTENMLTNKLVASFVRVSLWFAGMPSQKSLKTPGLLSLKILYSARRMTKDFCGDTVDFACQSTVF